MKKQNLGFSLLEALIASTIFAAVLLIASTAFKFFMGQGTREINSQSVMYELMNSIKVRESISATYSYFIKKTAISHEQARVFFFGSQEGFTGITVKPLTFEGQSTRYSVFSINNRVENLSTMQLVYCEYDNNREYPLVKIGNTCSHPIVLANHIKNVEYSYFGWPSSDVFFFSASEFNSTTNKAKKEWTSIWNAEIRNILPEYIKVTVEYAGIVKPYRPKQFWFKVNETDPLQYRNNNISYEE